MRPYLLYIFACGAMLLLIAAGLYWSQPAGAQPAAARPAAPQLTVTPSPTPTCPPGWTIYPDPAPPGDSVLNGITALTPNDLWAVGAYTSTGIITTTTLTVHGNGTSWAYVPSPNPPSSKSVLHAVAGVAANDVWAVGEYIGGQYGQWQTLTEHWDGTAWTIVPSPNYVYNNRLYAVTAIASNDVWAVGMTGSAGFHVWGLIEHWDGTSWSIVSTGLIPPLYGVVAVSANNVWAVGGGIPDYPAYGMSYIAHWDGSTWSTATSPANNGSSLHAVSVGSANDIWAVGYTGGYGTGQSLIEHWNGSAWTDVPSPNPGATTDLLYGVSARAANDVWAVGDTNQASGGVKTLALHWDGTGWYQAQTPDDPAGRGYFYAVAANGATGGVVWAVGEMGCTSGCTQNALIARGTPACLTPVPTWTPTATNTATPACGLDWRGVSGPNLPGGGTLNAVAVVSANDIWAVGRYYPNNYLQALTEHWDGTQWSIVPYDPNPGGTSELFSVAAVASNDVWAVGEYRENYTTLIEHWDGTSWSIVPSPSPSDYHPLLGVAAVASNDVWAVGEQQINSVNSTLIEHWNGSAWSVVSSPSVGNYSLLLSVAAVAGNANDIWAVGYSSGPQTLVEHWNGTQWSIVPSPGASQLQSVAAVAANDVWAVGCSLYCNQIGSQTLVEHWNGSTWSIVPSPNPFAGDNQLFAVAALAANDVWAVGFSSANSSPYQTLIEHWNGTQWSVVPGPSPPGSSLYGVAAVAANNVWAVGGLGYSGGFIAHYNDPCAGTGTPTRTPAATATPAATTTCVPGAAWSIRPERSSGDLRGVAAIAANDVWAVGSYQAQHWNGATWSVVPLPPGPGTPWNDLNGVAAIAANDVWAVGDYSNDGQTYHPLAEHWNGATWSIVLSSGTGILKGVAAVASNDVWAVGAAGLIEHWNGSTWSTVSNSGGPLYGVAAISANDVWAVGGGPSQTLTLHWNGATWSVVPSPNPGTEANFLYAVAAVATNDVWAVGYASGGAGPALLEHWNGATWSVVPYSPNTTYVLYGVAAVSTNDVWAVGYSSYPEVFHVTSMHWDGATWSQVPMMDHGQGAFSRMYGVAAVAANDVWAVGYDTVGTGSYTLIEHYPAPPCGAVTATPTPTNTAAVTTATNTPTATATCIPAGAPGPWTSRANYPQSRAYMAVASDGANVYSFGGHDFGGPYNQAYRYTYSTDTWAALAGSPDPFAFVPAEYGYNGKIYVIAGGTGFANTTRIYDIASNSWSSGAPVPTAAYVGRYGGAYWNGRIYVIGGYVETNAVYAYDIATDTWNTLAPLPQGEEDMAAAAINGKIYVANGYTSSGPTNNLYIYDIATNTWSQGASSPLASNFPGGTVIGGKLYLIGGGASSGPTGNTYIYDPATDGWGQGPSLNQARSGGEAATINTPGGQTALVVDGWDGTYWLNSVEASTLPGVPCAPPSATLTATSTRLPTNTPTGTSTRTATLPPTQTPGGPSATPVPTNTPTLTETPGGPSATPCAISFSDVHPADYFYTPVLYLACHGVISGYSEGTFRPYNNTTRSQMVKIVVLGFNKAVVTPGGTAYSFTDVSRSNPFFSVVETAYADGIVSGYTCGIAPAGPCDAQHRPWFLPYANVTRGQLSKIDVLAAQWPLYDPVNPTFTDVARGSTFYEVVETAVCHGVVSGYSNHTFRPFNNATRGQIAKIVYLSIVNPPMTCGP